MPIWENSARYTVTTVNALGQTVSVAPGETVDSNEDLSIYGFTLSGNAVYHKQTIGNKIIFNATVVGDAEGNGSFVLPYTDDAFINRNIQRIVMLPDEDDESPPDAFTFKVTNDAGAQIYACPRLDTDTETISVADGVTVFTQISESGPEVGSNTLVDTFEDLTFTLTGIGVGKKVKIRVILY